MLVSSKGAPESSRPATKDVNLYKWNCPALGHSARNIYYLYPLPTLSLFSYPSRPAFAISSPPAFALLVLFGRVLGQRLWLKSERSSLLASALSEIDEPKQPKQPSVRARKSSRRPRLSPALKTKAKRFPGKGTAGLGSNLQLSVIDILLAARRYSTIIPVKRT